MRPCNFVVVVVVVFVAAAASALVFTINTALSVVLHEIQKSCICASIMVETGVFPSRGSCCWIYV